MLNTVCEYTVSHDTVFTTCLLATIPGNQIIDDNRNLPIFRLDSVVVNWENQPVKTLCRKPTSFCCHRTFGCIVQWNFWLREREGTQSLVPRPSVCVRPVASLKNMVHIASSLVSFSGQALVWRRVVGMRLPHSQTKCFVWPRQNIRSRHVH